MYSGAKAGMGATLQKQPYLHALGSSLQKLTLGLLYR